MSQYCRGAFFLIAFAFHFSSYSQHTNESPKIIVGIVVDQLRYDLLTRFKQRYTEGGLKRLMQNGFFAENMHYNYVPTYTGPGHASIYTGTTPAIHGIAANNWWHHDKQDMYCTQDDSVYSIGGDEKSGRMSPKNLKSTTITDQLRLFSNFQSKTIGVALKDRGAILPAGATANAAYWYDAKTGNWISSSFYMKSLPNWVEQFNARKHQDSLLSKGWNLLYNPSVYQNIQQDNNDWEEANFRKTTPTFPYLSSPEKMKSDIRVCPFGNTLTTLFALKALEFENMGKGTYPDFLALSYSSTDYVGHACGPYSLEIEDTYYRLDLDIKQLLDELDKMYGKNNYWVFLTADHGVQDVPAYSNSHKIHGGNISENQLKETLNTFLLAKTGQKDIVQLVTNEQIYLNKSSLENSKLDAAKIAFLMNQISPDKIEGIQGFYSFMNIGEAPLTKSVKEKLINGYSLNRSGDIAILLEPNWMSHGQKGTTHGSPYSHDTHIPFIFFGKGVQPKSSNSYYEITDIAPTLSYLLNTLQPNGCIGKPIKELEYLKK